MAQTLRKSIKRSGPEDARPGGLHLWMRAALALFLSLGFISVPTHAEPEAPVRLEERFNAQRKPRVTVFDFEDTNTRADQEAYGSSVAAMMVTFLKTRSQFVVVERRQANLQRVLDEWKQHQRGRTVARPEGSLLQNVDAIIVGSVTLIRGREAYQNDSSDVLEVDVKLLSRKDGRIMAATQRRGPVECLRELVGRMAISLEEQYLSPYYGRVLFSLNNPAHATLHLKPIVAENALDEEKLPPEHSETIFPALERDTLEPWMTSPTVYKVQNLLRGWYSYRITRPGYAELGGINQAWLAERSPDGKSFTPVPRSNLPPGIEVDERFLVQVRPLQSQSLDADAMGLRLRKMGGRLAPEFLRQHIDKDFAASDEIRISLVERLEPQRVYEDDDAATEARPAPGVGSSDDSKDEEEEGAVDFEECLRHPRGTGCQELFDEILEAEREKQRRSRRDRKEQRSQKEAETISRACLQNPDAPGCERPSGTGLLDKVVAGVRNRAPKGLLEAVSALTGKSESGNAPMPDVWEAPSEVSEDLAGELSIGEVLRAIQHATAAGRKVKTQEELLRGIRRAAVPGLEINRIGDWYTRPPRAACEWLLDPKRPVIDHGETLVKAGEKFGFEDFKGGGLAIEDYRGELLPVGRYWLFAWSPMYEPVRMPVEVFDSPEPQVVQVPLKRRQAELIVRAPNAHWDYHLFIEGEETGYRRKFPLDFGREEARTISSLPVDVYRLTTDTPGHQSWQGKVDFSKVESRPPSIEYLRNLYSFPGGELAPHRLVSGRVTVDTQLQVAGPVDRVPDLPSVQLDSEVLPKVEQILTLASGTERHSDRSQLEVALDDLEKRLKALDLLILGDEVVSRLDQAPELADALYNFVAEGRALMMYVASEEELNAVTGAPLSTEMIQRRKKRFKLLPGEAGGLQEKKKGWVSKRRRVPVFDDPADAGWRIVAYGKKDERRPRVVERNDIGNNGYILAWAEETDALGRKRGPNRARSLLEARALDWADYLRLQRNAPESDETQIRRRALISTYQTTIEESPTSP